MYLCGMMDKPLSFTPLRKKKTLFFICKLQNSYVSKQPTETIKNISVNLVIYQLNSLKKKKKEVNCFF